jgi:hypothetical protein
MACLFVDQGVAVLASAWTRPEMRGRGCQTALIRRRLADAFAAGCTAVAEVVPGSQSERNLRGAGFAPAFTEAIWEDHGLSQE